MSVQKIKINDRVKRTMGIRQSGKVIQRFYGPFTDGQYRQPYRTEKPIYVEWDDGTKGWIDEACLTLEDNTHDH